LLKVVGPTLPLLNALSLFDLLLLHPDLVISDALDSFLKTVDLVIFHSAVSIPFVELIDEVPELLLLTLYVDIITL
jgi:hypothetical protein